MGKIQGSWSGMRKYLEKEMLADCLQGRIRYHCTTYVGMDGSHILELYVDDILMKQFSWETLNNYFIRNGYKENSNPFGIGEYWDEFTTLLRKIPMSERTEYTDDEFCEALANYRNKPIQDSIESTNHLERMFAILDRRIGKRTLARIKQTIQYQPEWLQFFYDLRLSAEQFNGGNGMCGIMTDFQE